MSLSVCMFVCLSQSVCLCSCVCSRLLNFVSNLHQFSCMLSLLWRRWTILCSSGFRDDVIFAYNSSGKGESPGTC